MSDKSYIDIDQEYDCITSVLKEKNTFKKQYPNKEIDFYYTDQAPEYCRIYNRYISSFYTPFGIKKMDSFYNQEIKKGSDSKFSKEVLSEAIIKNPHLHNVIKTNLLDNLNKQTSKWKIN